MGPVIKIKKLVIDSGAFLKNIAVWDYAEEFYSVPEVCKEIKDKQAQEFIRKFPYEIEWTQPKPSTIKLINDFTKKTGEFNSLSLADVKLLALTYDLEVEAKGGDRHLRKEPVERKTQNGSSVPSPPAAPIEGFYNPSNKTGSAKEENSAQVEDVCTSTEINVGSSVSEQPNAEPSVSEQPDTEPEENAKEIVYLEDIVILNAYLSTRQFIKGSVLDKEDCNIYMRLIARYSSLKAVHQLFYEFDEKKEKEEINFFERFCLNPHGIFFSIINRQESCAHFSSCGDLPSCVPDNCPHPKNCYAFDLCLDSSQCAHFKEVCRTIPSSELAPNDEILLSEFNKYCDFLRDVPFGFIAMRVAKNFYKFCKGKDYFKVWFFKLLRHFKHKGYKHDTNPYPEQNKVVKETLQQLREYDDKLKDIESSTKVFEMCDKAPVPEDNNNASAIANESSVTEIAEGIGSLNVSQRLGSEENEEESSNDEDDEGFITPSNINIIQSKNNSLFEDGFKDVHVACISSDFAVQNTLLHIGLKVIGINGKLIKSLRMYISKCFVCRTTCSDPEKLFCYKCGYKTLRKVSYTINPDGTKHIWESRKPINTRGMKFSLPAPKGGKHAVNPILCADQRVPQMRVSKRSSQRNDVLHEDYLARADESPFTHIQTETKALLHGINHSKSEHLGTYYWDRRNPNDPGRYSKSRRKH